MRGKKNEPSFIKYTLEKLSILKKTPDEMIEITTNNFNKLLSLKYIMSIKFIILGVVAQWVYQEQMDILVIVI